MINTYYIVVVILVMIFQVIINTIGSNGEL